MGIICICMSFRFWVTEHDTRHLFPRGNRNRVKNHWCRAHERAWVWVCSPMEGRVRKAGGGSRSWNPPTLWEEREQGTLRKAWGKLGKRSLEGLGKPLRDPMKSGLKVVPHLPQGGARQLQDSGWGVRLGWAGPGAIKIPVFVCIFRGSCPPGPPPPGTAWISWEPLKSRIKRTCIATSDHDSSPPDPQGICPRRPWMPETADGIQP